MITQCFAEVSLALVIPAPKPPLCPWCCPLPITITPFSSISEDASALLFCFLITAMDLSSLFHLFLLSTNFVKLFPLGHCFHVSFPVTWYKYRFMTHSWRKRKDFYVKPEIANIDTFIYICIYVWIYEYILCIHAHTCLYLTHICVYV